MGPCKLLTQTSFLEEVQLSNFNRLKYMDFSWFPTLTNKMVQKIYMKCKTVEAFKFAYYSQITDTVIETLSSYRASGVKEISFKSSSKDLYEMKDKFTDSCFAKFLTTYKDLKKFTLHTCTINLFTKTFTNELSNLIVLKFEHILLLKEENLDLVHTVKQCVNLQFLKIGNLRLPQRDLMNLSKEKSEKFRETFQALTKLKTLKIGQFAGNYLMKEIADHVPNLTKLVILSDSVDDDGLSFVLKKSVNLSHLNISECRMINGHCLDDILSRKLRKLVVNFEDYKCRCTQQSLLKQGILGVNTLVNKYKRR